MKYPICLCAILIMALVFAGTGLIQSETAASGAASNFAQSKLPAGSQVYEGRKAIYAFVPQPMTWPLANSAAKQIDRARGSHLITFDNKAEFDEVNRHLRFTSIAPAWVGYHRTKPPTRRDLMFLDQRKLRENWVSVTGEPVRFELFNSGGPDLGCKNKVKIIGGSIGSSGIPLPTIDYGKYCKPKENSAAVWHDNNGLLEDVSENHKTIKGFIVEIPKR